MTSPEQLSTRFYKALFTLVDDMRDRVGERQEFSNSWKITVQQLRLLRMVERLTRTKNQDGVMLKTLVEALNVTPAAVSGMVETMVKRDYLQRTQAEEDRRSVRIKLSNYCNEKITVLDGFFREMSGKIADHVPEEKFRKLVEALEELSADFDEIVPSNLNIK